MQPEEQRRLYHLLVTLMQDDPDDLEGWLLLGWTAPTPHAALRHFNYVLSLNPQNHYAKEGLAWARENLAESKKNEICQPQIRFQNPTFSSAKMKDIVSDITKTGSNSPAKIYGIIDRRARIEDPYLYWFALLYLLSIALAELIITFWIQITFKLFTTLFMAISKTI